MPCPLGHFAAVVPEPANSRLEERYVRPFELPSRSLLTGEPASAMLAATTQPATIATATSASLPPCIEASVERRANPQGPSSRMTTERPDREEHRPMSTKLRLMAIAALIAAVAVIAGCGSSDDSSSSSTAATTGGGGTSAGTGDLSGTVNVADN